MKDFIIRKKCFYSSRLKFEKMLQIRTIMSNIIPMSHIAMRNIILVFDIVIMLKIAKKRYESANFVLFGIVQA